MSPGRGFVRPRQSGQFRGTRPILVEPRRPRNLIIKLLVGILVGAGVIGLLAWGLVGTHTQRQETANIAPSVQVTRVPPAKAAHPVGRTTSAAEPPASGDADRQWVLPGDPQALPGPPTAPAPRRFTAIWVSTVPPNATASLDGRSAENCSTPCALHASRGSHRITIRMPGYETEYRHVDVDGATAKVQISQVTLRVVGGILMLTSIPAGADILLNGQETDELTPAKLRLPPGRHRITLDKHGVRVTEEVEILNGMTTFVRIPLPH